MVSTSLCLRIEITYSHKLVKRYKDSASGDGTGGL